MLFYTLYLTVILLLSAKYTVAGQRVFPNNSGYIIACFIVVAVTSLRFNVGWDYHSYFNRIYPVLDERGVGEFEPISQIVFYVSDFFRSPILVFVLFSALIYSLLFSSFLEYSKNPGLSLLVFFSLFYLDSMCVLRQWLAVAVVFYGFRFVRRKQALRYIAICGIAFFIHKSSLLALVVYPLYHVRRYQIILVCALILVIYQAKILDLIGTNFPLYGYYFKNFKTFQDKGGLYVRIFYLLTWGMCYAFARQRIDRDTQGLLSIAAFALPLPFFLGGHIGGRVGTYCTIYYAILIPSVLERAGRMFKILVPALFIAYFFLLLNTTSRTELGAYLPFKWYMLSDIVRL